MSFSSCRDGEEWFESAYCAHRSGSLEEALVKYNHAIAVEPNHVRALYNKSLVLFGLKRLRESETSIYDVLRSEPEHDNAILMLGIIQANKGFLEHAIACYCQAVQASSVNLLAWQNLAHAYGKLGMHIKAKAAHRRYKEAIEEYPLPNKTVETSYPFRRFPAA